MSVTIIGAGLAGSEAAWQLAARGVPVELYEMRPARMTKAHATGLFAELVCSSSFRGAQLTPAGGLLKEELRALRSLVMRAADESAVPAGAAFAVDRLLFSRRVDGLLRSHPLITVHDQEVLELPETEAGAPAIVAAGPLCSAALARSIEQLCGQTRFAFFDAISPIVYAESIDERKVFRQSRYNKGEGDDYINVPLSAEQYHAFVDEVLAAEKYGGHEEVEADCVEQLKPFEGCLPIEEMAARGRDTLRFGPLKPKGLSDPATGREPFAVLQLRQDDKAGSLWSMVGMQTRMKRREQERIFRALPGLEPAEFVRLGSVHRNSFINSPRCLNPTLEFRSRPGLFFAGQITGVEGYVESTAAGLAAGVNAARLHAGLAPLAFPGDTAIGALLGYISDPERVDFQPMNISFGLMPSYAAEPERSAKGGRIPKQERRLRTARRALLSVQKFADALSPPFVERGGTPLPG